MIKYKNSAITLFVLVCINSVQAQDCLSDDKWEKFECCINTMDSIVKHSNRIDTLYTCLSCINFLVKETKIVPSGKLTWLGFTEFNKSDFEKWKHWYDNNR